MKVLDLFSGIGGFSLGLERAGMETAAFCEINAYCRAVLRKHWPSTRIYENVENVTAAQLAQDGISFDLICGGFPCQDISLAGKGTGLDGERSNLWWEYHRLIEESRPAWAIIENVSALRSRGMDVVLGSLAALGYDAEWYCIPASAVGAPHQRDRLWIVAYANGLRAHRAGPCSPGRPKSADGGPRLKGYLTRLLADAESTRRGKGRGQLSAMYAAAGGGGPGEPSRGRHDDAGWWLSEPDVGRVADGVPSRVDRLRALGNAVIPQIPEMIGRAIMAWERAHVIP